MLSNQEEIKLSYDIVNNKLCPYCKSSLKIDFEGGFLHLLCPNYHIKVTYNKHTDKWHLIRVYFNFHSDIPLISYINIWREYNYIIYV